jgi:hypothetical protein
MLRARQLLRDVVYVDISRDLMDQAGTLAPPHLAVALSLGDDLDELVTYDVRMVAAATAHGIPVSSPS